jgi:hypothetical protein
VHSSQFVLHFDAFTLPIGRSCKFMQCSFEMLQQCDGNRLARAWALWLYEIVALVGCWTRTKCTILLALNFNQSSSITRWTIYFSSFFLRKKPHDRRPQASALQRKITSQPGSDRWSGIRNNQKSYKIEDLRFLPLWSKGGSVLDFIGTHFLVLKVIVGLLRFLSASTFRDWMATCNTLNFNFWI